MIRRDLDEHVLKSCEKTRRKKKKRKITKIIFDDIKHYRHTLI